MKNYIFRLFLRFVTTFLIVVALGAVVLLMKEAISDVRVTDILPECLIVSGVVFVGLTALEIYDLNCAALRHNVPLTWIVRAKYELGWNEVTIFFIKDFTERFEREMKQKK